MKSEAEIAMEVTLEMVVQMCDNEKDLAKEVPMAFVNAMRAMAQRGLDNARNYSNTTCVAK